MVRIPALLSMGLALSFTASGNAAEEGSLDPRGEIHVPIGIPDTLDSLKTFVEAEGSFSPGFGTYGIYFWLFDHPSQMLFAPTQEGVKCEHGLPEGGRLMPGSRWEAAGLHVLTEVCEVQRPSPRGDVFVTAARVTIMNPGAEARQVSLYAALRPLGAAGGDVNEIEATSDALVVNGHVAMVANSRPVETGVCSTDTLGRFAVEGRMPGEKKARSEDGNASGALRFDLKLSAKTREELGFICPVLPGRRAVRHRWDGTSEWAQLDLAEPAPAEGGVLQTDPGIVYCRSLRADGIFREAADYWRKFLGRTTIRVPDARWSDGMGALLGHVALCLNESAPDVAVVNYNVYTRDAVYEVNVLQKSGHQELASAAIDYLLEHPFSGRVYPEADNPGQILWVLGEQWQLFRNRAWLEKVFPSVGKLVDLIAYYRTTGGPHWVSLSSLEFGDSLPVEDRHELEPGRCDGHHPEYTEAFDVAGVRCAVLLARALGRDGRAGEWEKLADRLFREYDRRFGGELDKSYGSYCVLWPCRLYPLEDSGARGQFAGIGARSPQSWSYFPLATAHQGLLAGNRNAGYGTVGDHFDHPRVQGWYTLDEGGRSGTGGWNHVRTTWPRGKESVAMPHGWATAELFLLLRDSLLFEDCGRLVLLAGVPPAWFEDPAGLELEGLPTHFGPCSLKLQPQNGEMVLTLGETCKPPGGYVLRLPTESEAVVTVDGVPAACVDGRDCILPAGTREARWSSGNLPASSAPARQ